TRRSSDLPRLGSFEIAIVKILSSATESPRNLGFAAGRNFKRQWNIQYDGPHRQTEIVSRPKIKNISFPIDPKVRMILVIPQLLEFYDLLQPHSIVVLPQQHLHQINRGFEIFDSTHGGVITCIPESLIVAFWKIEMTISS